MRVAFLAALLALGAAPFLGGASEAQETQIDKVYACSSVTDAAARLVCFDAAVAAMKQAQASGDVSVVSRAQIQQAEKDSYGFGAAAQASAVTSAVTGSSATTAPELDVVKVTITTATKRPNGTYRFTLDNGQVWEQTDTVALGTLPRGMIEAEIRKASLGTFMLRPGNRSAVRVKRIK
jgi:hypothetical protein